MTLFVTIQSFGQSFNYQVVVRDASGAIIANQSVGVQLKIYGGSPAGGASVIYSETHSATTSAQGVLSLSVGKGTTSNSFAAINWSTQDQWLETGIDVTGGTNYVVIGASPLQHVPFANYAAISGDKTFITENNITSNAAGDITADDFLFGSNSLEGASTGSILNSRFFFDKSKSAFRAGRGDSSDWNDANVGNYSIGFGEGGIASGTNSFSMGRNANATGNEAFAFGTNAGGFADYARGFGLNARANGVNSTAIGRQLNANSLAEIQLGQYSNFVSGSKDTWVDTDRLFVIGNGQPDINLALNSDALVMLKNGNTTLNGTLTIDGDNKGTGRAFTLPAQDGTANQIMQTDGSGNISWVTPAASAIPNGGTNGYVLATDGAGVFSWVSNNDLDADPTNEIELPVQTGETGKFLTTDGTAVSWQNVPNELPNGGTNGQVLATDGSGVYSWVDQSAAPILTTTNNVTSNGNTTYGLDDFVFGAPTNETGFDVTAANRIFFDKSKAAFRVGRDIGLQNAFADANVGAYSAAFGLNPKAAGENAFAAGFTANASGRDAVALGNTTVASAISSIAMGNNSTASGAYATSIGRRVTAEAYGQTTLGYYNTGVAGNANGIVETDRLLVVGNGTTDITGVNSSDALVMLKNGNTTLNGTLTIDGDNQESGASYTLPAQDGAANQIMSTDGSGNVNWVNAPSQSVFTTSGNLTSNAGGNTATDDFLFGNSSLTSVSGTADDSRLFFDKSKSAFRVGQVTGNQWNDGNIGFHSGALGSNNIASGFATFAAGISNVVSGYAGSVLGDNNTVTGNGATAAGIRLTSESFAQFTVGQWNSVHPGSPDASGWISTDRLFVIGNGTTGSSKSDALVMLKNGNTTLNGSLTIDGDNQGAGASYTLPAQDGTANQVMTTDGSGNISWSDATASGPFSTTTNVTSNALGNTATDDFVFGSTQLDDDTSTTDDDSRMFFDKSKGAFRAGRAWGDQWDDANVERWTIAMGNASLAKGIYSVAIGDRNRANFDTSIALGDWVVTDAANSYGLGSHLITNSPLQTSLGVYNTEYTPVAPSSFTEPTNRLLVVGNGTSATRSDALVILRNGNTTLNGSLTIDGDNQGSGTSYTLPAQDGTANQVMTTDGAGNVSWSNAGGTFTTASNVTSNASGDIATDDFVFGSTQLNNDDTTTDDDTRMFFDKSKGAFRAGLTVLNGWDDSNVGFGSIALGNQVSAKGGNSIAIGAYSFAEGQSSASFGEGNYTSGRMSMTLGRNLVADSRSQVSLGIYNTMDATGDKENWVETDRLFVIGNGGQVSGAVRSDALVMLKNGNTTLNGSLTIDGDNQGSGASYTLPAQDGIANQVMTTDGSGNVTWIDVPTSAPAVAAYTSAGLNTAAGWENYNSAFSVTTFQDPRYRLNDNVVYLEGMVRKNAAIANGDTIMTLPVGFRPQKTRIFSVQTENGSIRVDVNPSGTVVVATGFNVNQNWVSLDGITFSID